MMTLTDDQFGVEKDGSLAIPRCCLVVETVDAVEDILDGGESYCRTKHSVLQT